MQAAAPNVCDPAVEQKQLRKVGASSALVAVAPNSEEMLEKHGPSVGVARHGWLCGRSQSPAWPCS